VFFDGGSTERKKFGDLSPEITDGLKIPVFAQGKAHTDLTPWCPEPRLYTQISRKWDLKALRRWRFCGVV